MSFNIFYSCHTHKKRQHKITFRKEWNFPYFFFMILILFHSLKNKSNLSSSNKLNCLKSNFYHTAVHATGHDDFPLYHHETLSIRMNLNFPHERINDNLQLSFYTRLAEKKTLFIALVDSAR